MRGRGQGTLHWQSRTLRLELDPSTAEVSCRRVGFSLPEIIAARVWVSATDVQERRRVAPFGAGGLTVEEGPLADAHGCGRQLTLTARQAADGLRLRLDCRLYDERPFLFLRLTAANGGRETFRLENFTLLAAERRLGGAVRLDSAAVGSQPVPAFFKAGWHDWVYSGLRRGRQRDVRTLLKPWVGRMLFDPALPIGRCRGDFWSEGWSVLTQGRQAVVAGFLTLADQFGQIHAVCRREDSSLALIAPCDGVPLAPGEERSSEWGYLEFVDLPNPEPLGNYAGAVARETHPRVPAMPPPLEWTHWYQFFQDISEERFLAAANKISGLNGELPFRTLQLDDGYQPAWGDWELTNPRFPRGLGYLAARIRERGFMPGLWLAPFVVQPGSRLEREHADWLLRDAQERLVRSGFFYSFFGYALDLSQPEVLEHLRRLGETLRGWGFGFIKADFCYAGALPGSRHDPHLTRAQALRRGLEALRAGIGEDAFLLGCGCPFGPALGLVDAMRIGPDTAPSWHPELWNLPWTRPLLRSERSVASLRNNLRHTLAHSALHRRWWWNDPDCLLVRDFDTRLSEAEVQSALSLIGLSGGLVISSDDLARLPAERRRLIALLAPILSPGGRALDLLEREMPELYQVPLRTEWASWQLLLVGNWSDRARERTLELESLGLAAETPLHVFDFWQRGYRRYTGPRLPLGRLEPHASRLLRLSPAEPVSPAPCLVGDTLHITQGLEIAGWEATERRVRITLPDLGRRVEGELWLHLPGAGHAPQTPGATCGGLPCWVQPTGPELYAVEIRANGATVVEVHW
jgi:alpha-galactosidase